MRAVIDKIMKAKSVAVFPHVNEDPDALGSCFAFAKVMRKMGKKATVYVSGRVESRLAFIGDDYVLYHDGIKHDHDLCACLDCGDIDRITERKSLFDEINNSVNIDHHYTNTNFADANYVDGKAAAAAEIIFEIFKEMNVELDSDIAKDLYTAICSDTGCFKYSNVTPKTMRIAADLLEYDFDHADIARLLFDSESLEAAKLKAEITNGIKPYADGKIEVVVTDENVGEKYGIEKEDIPNLVDIPRRIEGTEIAVCIKHIEDGFRLNLRSNGDADVSKVAMKFGGGGHVKAAGATLHFDTAQEAETAVVEACIEALEEIE
ncbi:MAG: bifunctional oligoribonuclease/PAP phosphatase NrnA [Clostridia bacterium]|nr:bifunctional oligoribonuclease/PAP phosphatase NrnA [Clostridia bacterium]